VVIWEEVETLGGGMGTAVAVIPIVLAQMPAVRSPSELTRTPALASDLPARLLDLVADRARRWLELLDSGA
jgi:hypothetical protein